MDLEASAAGPSSSASAGAHSLVYERVGCCTSVDVRRGRLV